MNYFLILLKKELIECMQNKKFWSFVIFVISAVAAIFFAKRKLPEQVYLILIVMLVSQYVFDSCYNDIRSGGALFFLNIRCGSMHIIAAKAVYSLIIGTLLFIPAAAFLLKEFGYADLIWLLTFFAFVTGLTYNAAILTKKSDLLTSLVTSALTLGFLQLLPYIPSLFLRFVILCFLSCLIIILASKLSKTIKYRAEISAL